MIQNITENKSAENISNQQTNQKSYSSMKLLKHDDIQKPRQLSSISSISRISVNKKISRKQIKIGKKLSCEQFTDNVEYILNYYHQEGSINYQKTVLNILKGQAQNHEVKINQRFSLMLYLQPTLKYKNFTQIEEQIIKEWKKNPILYILQIVWIKCILKYKDFSHLKQFKSQLQNQKNFIGQLSFNLFKSYLQILLNKGFPIIDKLVEQTSIHIISSFSDWKSIPQQIIFKLLKNPNCVNMQLNLSTLQLQKHIIEDINSPNNQFSITTQCLQRFMKQFKMKEKIKLLKKFRFTLEQQIRSHQEKMISQGKMNCYKIAEKDDFIGSIIYCLVKGNCNQLYLSLKYFQILFDDNCSSILSTWNVDSYKADLEAAWQYISLYSLRIQLNQ